MPRALLCECGDCATCKHREYMRDYYRRPGVAETVRARVAQYRNGNLEKVRAADRARGFRPSGVEKVRARKRAQALERGLCEVCGAENVDAHHDDYSRPLDVRWLCRRHHMALHRQVP